jgi:MFS family permease
VAILAPWIGYWSELWGRKPLLLAGFGIEAVRALLFAFVSDPVLMLVVQVLDGATGAAVTVLTILVTTSRPAPAGSIWHKACSARSAASQRRSARAR